MEKLSINVKELGIEMSKAKQIKETFAPMAEMLRDQESAYNELIARAETGITSEISADARVIRLFHSKIRIDVEKARKERKEKALREGKAVDAISNIYKWAVGDREEQLIKIENHAKIEEEKRLDKLQSDRVDILSKYVEDANSHNLSEMDEDVWSAYLQTKKKNYEDLLEAEKQAEADKIKKENAYKAEQIRIKKENDQLRTKNEEAEKLAKVESEKKRKLESELKEKRETELKAEHDKKEAIEKELKKGDLEKIKDLVDDLKLIKSKYKFDSSEYKEMYKNVQLLVDESILILSK